MFRVILAAFLLIPAAGGVGVAQDKIFSGPQAGEKLPPFKVRAALSDDAGKDVDFVKQAAGKPLVLVFVHEANRPSLGFVRTLTSYTSSRAKDGLQTGVVFLGADLTEEEAAVKRMQGGLTKGVPTGISLDGKEGPGSYGLNRNVTLTILVAKDDKVTANFALVQPSIQADLPKVLVEIVKVAGGEVPKLEELAGVKEMMAKEAEAPAANPEVSTLMRQLIQLKASPEDVNKVAAKMEALAKESEPARKDIGRVARTIVEGGKLLTYGTPRAQEHLLHWAQVWGMPAGQQPAPDARKKP